MNFINEKDLLHFNEKGWVVIKNVLTPKEISAYLQKTGFDVIEAINGKEA